MVYRHHDISWLLLAIDGLSDHDVDLVYDRQFPYNLEYNSKNLGRIAFYVIRHQKPIFAIFRAIEFPNVIGIKSSIVQYGAI